MRKYSCSQHQCQKPYERDRKIISTYSHQLALILSSNLRICQTFDIVSNMKHHLVCKKFLIHEVKNQ